MSFSFEHNPEDGINFTVPDTLEGEITPYDIASARLTYIERVLGVEFDILPESAGRVAQTAPEVSARIKALREELHDKTYPPELLQHYADQQRAEDAYAKAHPSEPDSLFITLEEAVGYVSDNPEGLAAYCRARAMNAEIHARLINEGLILPDTEA
jgi:hypothetical protein